MRRFAPDVRSTQNPAQENPSSELFPNRAYSDSRLTLYFHLLPTCFNFEFDPGFPTTCFRFGRSGSVFAGKVKKTPSLFHIRKETDGIKSSTESNPLRRVFLCPGHGGKLPETMESRRIWIGAPFFMPGHGHPRGGGSRETRLRESGKGASICPKAGKIALV